MRESDKLSISNIKTVQEQNTNINTIQEDNKMILGRIKTDIFDDFTVTDQNNNLVVGINPTTFTVHLFNNINNTNNKTPSPSVTIFSIGHGHYCFWFTPNHSGLWVLTIYHSIYFPQGKTYNIQIFANNFDTITTLITYVLGLTREDFYIDNIKYDNNKNLTSSRIRLYTTSANVGGDNGVITEYNMVATYIDNKIESYKVNKINKPNNL